MAVRSLPLLLLPSILAWAQNGDELLVKVDRLRQPWSAFQVEVQLQGTRLQQRWRVSVRENGDARVDGRSEKEVGRTVLLLGDEMWLLLPGSKRPLRVTPQQRLLGPAAGGDLARFRLAKEYEVKGKEDVEEEGQPCWKLELVARKASLSYRTASLWIHRGSGDPLKAEFRLASGKLARILRFEKPGEVNGRRLIPAFSIEEPRGEAVRMSFQSWKPGNPDSVQFELPALR